ncbi:hypothetical protein BELL_0055g00110 [Botrytis elliptica]|uniref:Uncharacterized protein n=1 Tax=Botrytis elliptica TaxID=278938 RepID=A0A4Z1JZ07_9HELO|nr:hypothetical protein BELL_0055g00110 [Botrytis elliptica]
MEGASEDCTLQTEILLRPEIHRSREHFLGLKDRVPTPIPQKIILTLSTAVNGLAKFSAVNSSPLTPAWKLDPLNNFQTICNHIASTRTSGIVAHGDQMTAGRLNASWAIDTRN